MQFTDDEAQVLALLASQAGHEAPIDDETLDRLGERYWTFKGDYHAAAASLAGCGLISGSGAGWTLSEAGAPLAGALLRERPDMYFYYYREFYPRAWASEAHSELCRRVFGRDLCQEGMTDMATLDGLLDRLELRPGQRVLDLGCGAGGISNYIHRRHGVHITGIDNARPAIAQARKVFADRAEQLTFIEADLNALSLEAGFDAAVAIDVLYWVADLAETVRAVQALVKPGGQMGVIMTHSHEPDEGTRRLAPRHTAFGKVANQLGLAFEAADLTDHNHAFWKRNYKAARALGPAFEAEGNGFIADSLIREAEEDFLPAFEAGRISRYLFHLRLP